MIPAASHLAACNNAMCESFFAMLECELLDRKSFPTATDARSAIFRFIEGFYNTHRLHSSIGYEAPVSFERLNYAA